MKRIDLRKAFGGAALIGAALWATTAAAAPVADDYCPGYGMGPAMMGGQGIGPGMMSGQGYGMGPGMMMGRGAGSDLKLDAEQRRKIAQIHDDLRRKHWELIGKMHDEQARMDALLQAASPDDAALGKGYRAQAELRQQMFEQSLDAQKQIDALLSKEQREKMRRGG